jgi:Tol biopolymer transport system component
MKQCPQCKRVYTDETQNFCLDDGIWLVTEQDHGPPTAILGEETGPGNAAARELSADTRPTEILSQGDRDPQPTVGWSKSSGMIAAALLLLIAVSVGAWMYRSSGTAPEASGISFQSAKISRLTASGKVIGAVISPDGKYVAHVVDDGGQQSVWVRQAATSSNMQLVAPAKVAYSGLAFSPDGNYVYYSVYEREQSGVLYQLPVLGGSPRKLLTGIGSAVAFSPDGRQMAFFQSTGLSDEVIVANADGTNGRSIATRGGDEQFFRGTFSTLAWSPDGKTIAGPLRNFPENYMSVFAVSVESGEIKAFSSKRWFDIKQVAWLTDGNRLLLTAQDTANADFNIWEVSFPSGDARKVTNDLNSYRSVSLTADNTALVTVQAQRKSDIWVMNANDSAHASQVTHDSYFNSRVAWTHDGRLIYSSNANGTFDLYSMDADGNNPKQLTANAGWNGDPSVTPDGRTIFFMSDRSGPPHIWRMDIDGGNQNQLTTEAFNVRPQLSPNARWIVYASSAREGWYIWKMPAEGGQPVQLTQKLSDYPVVSPDGKHVACFYSEGERAPNEIAILSIDGGAPIKLLSPPLPAGRETNLEWSADGRAVIYGVTNDGVTNLWALPLDGGGPKQITNFTSERILWFDISPDGRKIALSRGMLTSDVVLIKDFR